jgi:uncharacterized protein
MRGDKTNQAPARLRPASPNPRRGKQFEPVFADRKLSVDLEPALRAHGHAIYARLNMLIRCHRAVYTRSHGRSVLPILAGKARRVNVVLLIGLGLAALLYSSVGHAGASGYLAVMALGGVEPAVMKPAALVLNLLVATIATMRFSHAGHFSFRVLWPFAVGSIPFAFVGGGLQIPTHWYKQTVGAILLASAARLFVESRKRPDEAIAHASPPVLWAIPAGVLIGFLAGLTGTGGGIFLSPLLLFTGWSGTRDSGGVSAAFILLNSAAGLAGNLVSVRSLPSQILAWTLVVAFGGLIGSELGSRRVATTTFRKLLALVLLVAGMKLVLLI